MKLNGIFSVLGATALLLSLPVAAERSLIQNKGSDTLVNVAQAWAEHYSTVNPGVAVAVSGGGSGTGIAALMNGTVDIANSSRKMTDKENAEARKSGINPVEHVVGYDALAVFVHKANPLRSVTLGQLAQIYGRDGKVTRWTDLGVQVPGCDSDEIVVVSRQNNSGTYAYFKEAVLKPAEDQGLIAKGKFRQGTLDMHGSKDVADLVEKTPCAIGYSGLAYAGTHITTLCVAPAAGKTCVQPSVSSATDGSYLIARPLFMYTGGEPQGAIKAYLDWIKSDTGQCIISKMGYAPYHHLQCP